MSAFNTTIDSNIEETPRARRGGRRVAQVDRPPVAPGRVRIVLEENDNIPPTGLFVGVNGRSYLLRSGEEMDVPEEVLSALDDAVESSPRTDSAGNILDYRDKLRFPYRVV